MLLLHVILLAVASVSLILGLLLRTKLGQSWKYNVVLGVIDIFLAATLGAFASFERMDIAAVASILFFLTSFLAFDRAKEKYNKQVTPKSTGPSTK